MIRDKALALLFENVKNVNLRKHCFAVEAVMRALYKRFNEANLNQEEEERWAIAGLLHDADYELTKDTAKVDHTKHILKWLEELDAHVDIKDAIASHAFGYVSGAPEPVTRMQWSLYCCDELTGLIVAVALVKPEKKLSSVTVESVLNKWKSKSFASGVDRKQIETCEERLNTPLADFIEIALLAMQGIHDDLGL